MPTAITPPAADFLEAALEAAHLPTLVMSLVHATGDGDLLRPEWRPDPEEMARGRVGIPEARQEEIRAKAREILPAFLAGHGPRVFTPDAALARRMMDFITGRDLTDDYVDFLLDELALEGTSSKEPRWSPAARHAAADFKVLVVGAGMSGLLAGMRLSQAGIEFQIVEKNTDVGGTWLENAYPGCRVDTPNHFYSYSFESDERWPQLFSTQPVLLNYFRRVAERHGLRDHIRFETKVVSMTWDAAANLWAVRLQGADGSEETVHAQAVITAVGQLNQPKLPDIPCRDSFAGPAFHSARWDAAADLAGKRVAVIGTGASAFQIVPEIAGEVAELKVFQRTPPWRLPSPNYHRDVSDGLQWLLDHAPGYSRWRRFQIFWAVGDSILPQVTADPDWQGEAPSLSAENDRVRRALVARLEAEVADRPDLVAKTVPSYPFGGKRSLLDNGLWAQTLKRDNVELITEPITGIDAAGVSTGDGARHEVDAIIYATGFHASRFLHGMEITGRDGARLHDLWNGDARAHLGMTVPGLPNFFMIYGPNTNLVINGSIIFFSECAVRYVLGCLEMLLDSGAPTIEPKQAAFDAFNVEVDAANAKMAWGDPRVNSWYKNDLGRVSQNWPWGLVDYWRRTLAPDPADFDLA